MQFITVDVFTDTPFLGNPLAVVIVEDKERAALGKDKQQLIAKEFNLCKHHSSPFTAPSLACFGMFQNASPQDP